MVSPCTRRPPRPAFQRTDQHYFASRDEILLQGCRLMLRGGRTHCTTQIASLTALSYMTST